MGGGRKCIIRRFCDSCSESHRDIYYQRITDLPPPGRHDDSGEAVFDASAGEVYFLNTFMNDWFDNVNGVKFNVLGTDFNLYSSYEDAKAGTNPWAFSTTTTPRLVSPGIAGPKDMSRGSGTHMFTDTTKAPLTITGFTWRNLKLSVRFS